MAFFYSASTRLSLPIASSSAASSTASLTLPPPQQQQPLPNPQIQNPHPYQQLQPQPPSHLVAYAMDSSSSTSSSTSSHHHRHQPQQPRQQQQQQQSPRPLQGPRPAPLKVRKDSYKIKKPPVAPHHHPSGSGPTHQHPASQQQLQQQQLLPRQPVIIYTVSPKVIHTKPGDFMSLVQRLTGVNSSPTAAAAAAAESQPSPGAFPSPGPAGAMSPAAKLATIEKVHQQSVAEYLHHPYRSSAGAGGAGGTDLDSLIEQFETTSSAAATAVLDYRTGNNNLPFPPPAILSPNPSSLPAISPSFFASDGDLSFLQNFLNGLSPMAGGAAAAAAVTSTITAAAPAMPAPPSAVAAPPPVSASPITNRGGFIDSSFLLSPSGTGSQLAFASSLLAPSPGGFWDRPSGFGFTPNAGAPSPNWDLFGPFPDL